MQKYVEKEEVLKIPYIFTTLSFSLRPDHELDLLHHFFIKAISKNASVSDIAVAINLPKKVVLEEFTQMCNQGYLNSNYQLTDYAKKYLEFVNFIDELKMQTPSFYINLLNKNFVEEISSVPISDAIEMSPKVSKSILENIGFSGIKDYLSSHFDSFKNKSSEFIDKLTECMDLQFKFKNDAGFNKKDFDFEYVRVKRIPCYSSNFIADENRKSITAKGTFYYYEFKCVVDRQFESRCFEIIKKQKNEVSISREEKKLISEYNALKKNKNKIFQCWVDSVSGDIIFTFPSDLNVRNANIVLKEYLKRTDELDKNVLSKLMEEKKLSSNYKLKLERFERVPYYVCFDINEILAGGEVWSK